MVLRLMGTFAFTFMNAEIVRINEYLLGRTHEAYFPTVQTSRHTNLVLLKLHWNAVSLETDNYMQTRSWVSTWNCVYNFSLRTELYSGHNLLHVISCTINALIVMYIAYRLLLLLFLFSLGEEPIT
jgi:hypothetical protein